MRAPRGRAGGDVPSLLEPRKRAARALVAVAQAASVPGVSPRRVDDLVQALGRTGISKRQVSRLCADRDAEVARFRPRRWEGPYPYVWVEATFVKVGERERGRVGSQAVVLASGGRQGGAREVLGMDVGPSEDGAFWLPFLRALVARGLSGVPLVISDAHEGLTGASAAVLGGSRWQRCRRPFVRNCVALAPKTASPMVAATMGAVFVPPAADSARQPGRRVADGFRPRYPRLAAPRENAAADGLASRAFPPEHGRQGWSNHPLDRLTTEVKRRPDVVGIFPNPPAVPR